jgi:hypothetical protein
MTIAVIVEDDSDKAIVESVLGSVVKDLPFEVVSARGRSSAISLARSYFAFSENHVALLLDSDSVNPRKVQEQRQILTDMLAAVAPAWAFEVVLAVPEIEICLFQDPQALKATFGDSLTSEALLEARFVPSIVLKRLLANVGWKDDYETAVRKVVSSIAPLEALAECSPLKEVRSFIEAAPRAESIAREARQLEQTRQ